MGRWRFLDSSNPAEGAERERVLALIDAFWAEFVRREDEIVRRLSGGRELDLADFMAAHLGAVDSRITWAFGPAVSGKGRRLVLTPENAKDLRPLVHEILERAPELDGWEFYGWRLPESLETAKATVKARTQGDLDGVRVCVKRGPHNLIDLSFLCPSAREPDDERAMNDVFVAAETLLGERLLDRWIGAIGVVPLPPARRALSRWFGKEPSPEHGPSLDLGELRPAVEQMIEEIRAKLPGAPHHAWPAEDVNFTLLELEPADAEDYPEQLDLLVAKTQNLPLWQAAHDSTLFYDERFTRWNETFAYVKVDGGGQPDEQRFELKTEIEDALDDVLMPAGLGCQIGGGLGRRYLYVDLALADLDAGIRAACERLRAAKLPRRAWIQFFGAELSHEWVGVYPDSPPPPMADSALER